MSTLFSLMMRRGRDYLALKIMNIRRKGGFTLVELMIVICMIGILAGIVTPGFLNWKQSMNIQRDSREVLNAIKSARIKAINLSQPVTFTINTATKSYFVTDSGGTVLLDGGFSSDTDVVNDTVGGSIQFNSRGIASTSGHFDLNNGKTYKTITVYITGASKIL